MSKNYILKEELQKWIQTSGDEITSESGYVYYQIDYKHKKRRKAFVTLIEHLIKLGESKGFFTSGPSRDRILEFSIAPKCVLKKKYGWAFTCAIRDLDLAIGDVFGTESEYYEKNGKVRVEIKELKPDSVSLEEKIKQETEQDEIEQEIEQKATIKAEEKKVEKTLPPPVVYPKPVYKKFHESMTQQEGVEPMPETEPCYDPEMRKWLGYKDK